MKTLKKEFLRARFAVGMILMIAAIAVWTVATSCSVARQTPAPPITAANVPVNAFEANAYKTLLDSQAGLLKASEEMNNGKLPPSLKPDLNRAIVVHNTANQLLKNYDVAARAGNDVTAQEAEIAQDLGTLLQLLANLSQAPAPATK